MWLILTMLQDDALVHFVDRDPLINTMIFNNDGTTSVSIYNVADGAGIPVSISSNAQTYLNGALNPLTDLR